MSQARYRAAVLIMTFGATLVAALCFSAVADAQDELRAYRQVAYESGQGTLTVKKGPGDA